MCRPCPVAAGPAGQPQAPARASALHVVRICALASRALIVMRCKKIRTPDFVTRAVKRSRLRIESRYVDKLAESDPATLPLNRVGFIGRWLQHELRPGERARRSHQNKHGSGGL